MSYKLVANRITGVASSVIRMADGASIPFDEGNTDYVAYQEWLAQDNTPLSADPAPVIPATCSPWQIRKALNQLGLRQQVEEAISVSSDMTLQDGWEFATELRSDDPFVLAMGVALGKTEEETREIIAFASTL